MAKCKQLFIKIRLLMIKGIIDSPQTWGHHHLPFCHC